MSARGEEIERSWLALCGSRRWARLMAAGGPYRGDVERRTAAARAFDALTREDWLEAFAAHSSIGAPRWGDRIGAGEQSGLAGADDRLRDALAAGSATYRARFGFPFLIRARGRTGEEMLAALRARLQRPAAEEFATACAQQREITALRMAAR